MNLDPPIRQLMSKSTDKAGMYWKDLSVLELWCPFGWIIMIWKLWCHLNLLTMTENAGAVLYVCGATTNCTIDFAMLEW